MVTKPFEGVYTHILLVPDTAPPTGLLVRILCVRVVCGIVPGDSLDMRRSNSGARIRDVGVHYLHFVTHGVRPQSSRRILMWIMPATTSYVPGIEARFYRSIRLLIHALEADASRRPSWVPNLFMAGWPRYDSLVSGITLVYYDQTVRKPDSYAAVEHPLRLAFRASDSRRAKLVITSPLLKRWVPTTWHFPIAI